MSSNHPTDSLTPDESESLARLEATLQQAYLQADAALAGIGDRHLYRDTHPSFETYLRDRWGLDRPPARSKPCEDLARACEQTLTSLAADERPGVELRLAIRGQEDPDPLRDARSLDPWAVARLTDDDLLATLRWLLTQASGTVADVAHQLEAQAVDIDDRARVQLGDDVFVLEDELNAVKELLLGATDWDAELERLLNGEIPPHGADTDPEDDG
jgi:hypothetical protein